MNPVDATDAALAGHEQARADFWALIGALLLRPTVPLLQALAAATGLPGGMGTTGAAMRRSWGALTAAARALGPEAVQREHAALFAAPGTPRVDPRGSRYCGAVPMDRPLVRLRGDLRALGLARRHGAAHTEDHLGALCETMRLLITGTPDRPGQPLRVQREFFAEHILPWAAACLDDLRAASGARFHAALADLAQAFLEVERQAFELDTHTLPEPPDARPAAPLAATA